MDEKLHRDADKLGVNAKLLAQALDQEQVELALSIVKRVRRESTLLVKALASLRDNQLQD